MKKIILFAVAALMLTNVCTVSAFTDIASSEYKKEIEFFEQSGILDGKEEGKFYPNDTLTRAEAAKIFYELVCSNKELSKQLENNINSGNIFADVTTDFWAHNEINRLAYEGIIEGYGDGNYYPNEELTGIQLLTICVNTTGYATFADESLEWKEQYTKIGTEYGFLDGVTFNIDGVITRAQAAKLIYNSVNLPIVENTGLRYDENTGKLSPVVVFKDGSNGEEKQSIWSIYESGETI